MTRKTIETPAEDIATVVRKRDLVDTAGVEILKDFHHAERKRPKREEPKERESPEIKPRFSSQTTFLLSLAIICLFLTSVFAYKYFTKPEILTPDEMHAKNLAGKLDPKIGYVYKGFSFVYYDKLWFTQMHRPGTDKLYNIQLHYSPRDLENVSLGDGIERFGTLPSTYVTFDPRDEKLAYIALAAGEFGLSTAVVLNMTPVPACMRNETAACAKVATISCAADKKHAIVELTRSGTAKAELEGNCLKLFGEDTELIRALDRVLLLWMGIMPRE